MKIQSAAYNIIFPKVNNIRREFLSLEEKLGGLFATPFSIPPIPDNAPEEIPRITAISPEGHSNLNISLNTAQLVVNYDNKFWSNIDDCLGYVEEHVTKIIDAIGNIVRNEFLFSGLTLNIIFDDLGGKDPIDLILNNFYKTKLGTTPFDIRNKVTFVMGEKYYINISYSNVRLFENINQNELNPLSDKNQMGHVIGVSLDINDRYAFNYHKGYKSNRGEIDDILDLTKNILTDKIEDFILKGEFEL